MHLSVFMDCSPYTLCTLKFLLNHYTLMSRWKFCQTAYVPLAMKFWSFLSMYMKLKSCSLIPPSTFEFHYLLNSLSSAWELLQEPALCNVFCPDILLLLKATHLLWVSVMACNREVDPSLILSQLASAPGMILFILIPHGKKSLIIILYGMFFTFDFRFDFSVELRTSASDGVIFYTADATQTDFVALYMKNGQLVYAFNCGSGTAVIMSDMTYNDNQWHKVCSLFCAVSTCILRSH